MKLGWIIPFIIVGGALQACGGAMNGQLKNSLVNPYLASAVSFFLIAFFFTGAFFVMPTPLPTVRDLAAMPWWAVLGGFGRSCSGLRIPHPDPESGGRTVYGFHRYCRFDYFSCHRPLRLVPLANPPYQWSPGYRGFAIGRRHNANCQVLDAPRTDRRNAQNIDLVLQAIYLDPQLYSVGVVWLTAGLNLAKCSSSVYISGLKLSAKAYFTYRRTSPKVGKRSAYSVQVPRGFRLTPFSTQSAVPA